MKTGSLVAILALAVLIAGCAGPSSTPQAASGPPANVAGSWTGGTVGAAGASVQMQLAQTGTGVSGRIDVSGRPDVSGPLTGTVSGNTVRFKLTSGYGSTGELNVSGNTITGMVGGNGVRLQRMP
jgi:hypothetical protein